MDIRKAINFVTSSNSKIEIAKLNVILGNDIEVNSELILDHYSSLQNKDGGFPHQRKAGLISTINVTTGSLHTLLDYGLEESTSFKSGIEFLIKKQHSDGY